MKVFLALFSPFSRFVCRIKSVLCAGGGLKSRKAFLPVISIGNISFGGTGKTPAAMELIAFFLRRGWKPALVSRGYKGSWEKSGGILSDGQTLLGGWKQGGDESFLAAKKFPAAGVFVGRNRLESCRKAKDLGFTVAVLDDAFQHLRLERDLDIVLFDPQEKIALRENRSSLRRADVILMKSPVTSNIKNGLRAAFPDALIFEYRLEARGFIDVRSGNEWPEVLRRRQRVQALSGIANPKKFLSLLETEGLHVVSALIYPDHYSYPAAALKEIARQFRESEAEAIITTEKDAVKIAFSANLLEHIPLYVLKIGLEIETSFYDAVERIIGRAGQRERNSE